MPGTVDSTSRSVSRFCCRMVSLPITVMVCGVSSNGRVYLGDSAFSTLIGDSSMAVSVTVIPPSLAPCAASRSEEHTSELQSLMRSSYAVFCLKKKNDITDNRVDSTHDQQTEQV